MNTRMNIAVRGLFATPVAALEVPGSEARNAELSAIILKKRETTHRFRLPMQEAGTRTANRGLGRPSRRLHSRSGQRDGQPLDRRSKRQIGPTQMERHGVGERQRAGRREIATIIQARSGPGPTMSLTAAALRIPVWAVSSKCSIPAAPALECTRRALKFMGEDGQSVGAAETIRPRPGLLFLFPSWLFHQVRPYRGDGLRISIAFNLSV